MSLPTPTERDIAIAKINFDAVAVKPPSPDREAVIGNNLDEDPESKEGAPIADR